MLYNSVRDRVWERLITNLHRRKDAADREEFLCICEAFYQAEDCPSSKAAIEIKLYRAEYNIWAYFFGEDSGFPGKDPRNIPSWPATPASTSSDNRHFEPSQTTNPTSSPTPQKQSQLPHKIPVPESSSEIRELLEERWRTRSGWQDFKPQLGWDPSTGTPWMSICSYSEDAYPAMTGSHHRYLKTLEKKIPKFVIRYERFFGCLVIWIEFKDQEDMEKRDIWEEYNMLRCFFVMWAEERKSRPVYKAYNEFLKLDMEERGSLLFPEGFILERGPGFYGGVVAGGTERGFKEQMFRIKGTARESHRGEDGEGRGRYSGRDDVQCQSRDRSTGYYRDRTDDREERGRERSLSTEGTYYQHSENRRGGRRRPRSRSPREVDRYRPRY